MEFQQNPLAGGAPQPPPPPQPPRPAAIWFSRRNLIRAGGVLVVAALGIVIAGLLMPNSTFKPEKRAAPSKATGSIRTRTISKAVVDPTQNATTLNNIADQIPAAPPAPAPTTVAAVFVNNSLPNGGGGGANPPNKAKSEYGDDQTTDDPDDDYGADDTKYNPVAHPSFNQLVATSWAAWGGAAAQVCHATTGKELRKFAEGDACTVIILTRGSAQEYTLAKSVTVRGRKIILGHPLDMPTVNAYDHHIGRAFTVAEGAYLDIRFVNVVRAYGDKVGSNMKVIAGACITVMPRGTLIATGCIFRTETQDLNQYLYDVEIAANGLMYRVFGGFVLQLGGYIQLNGCVLLTFRPYGMPYLDNGILGRDACVVAGFMNLIGSHDVTIQAYSNSGAIGTVTAVLGGAMVWTGGSIVSVLGIQAQYGAGHVMFTGGGAMIAVGLQYVTVLGALSRGGFGSFTNGGGVSIYVGFHMARAWGVAAIHNYGHTLANGAGVMHFIGCSVVSATHQWFFSGNGGTAAQGIGDMYVLGTSQARAVVCQVNFGLGFFWANGAGITKVIGTPVTAAQVVRALIGLGSEVYTGAGIVIAIGNVRALTQVVAYFGGLGTYMYLGAGGMLLVGTRVQTARVVEFPDPDFQPAFVVGGNAVTTTAPKAGPVWLTNRHRNLMAYMSPESSASASRQVEARSLVGADGAVDTSTGEPVLTASPTVQATGASADATSPIAATIAEDNSTVAPTSAPSSAASAETTVAPTSAPTAADPLLNYTNSVFVVDMKVRGTTKIRRTATSPVTSAPTAANDTKPTARRTARKTSTTTPAAPVRRGLFSAFPTFEKLSASMEHVFEAPEPRRYGLLLTRTNPSRCLIADLDPAPSSAWLLNGSSPCQALDLNVSSSEPMDHVAAAQAAADPPLPWVTRMMPYAEAMRRDPKGKHPLPDTGIITNTITLSCSNAQTDKCVSDATLRDVLLGLFGPQGEGDYSIAVATEAVPDKWSGMLQTVFRFDYKAQQGASDSGCPVTTTYKVYTTTHHNDLHKILGDQWDLLTIKTEPLYTALNEALAEANDPLKICDIDVRKEWKMAVAPEERTPGYKPSSSRVLWPTIELTDGVSLSPVSSVTPETAYHIHVYNFPQDHNVKIDLVKGVKGDVSEVTTIKGFQDKGYMTLDWKTEGVPSKDNMRCFLRATDTAVPMLEAMSQAFFC